MNTILVTTSRGLDELLKQEIELLCPQAEVALTPGLVKFSGTLEQAYTVCLWSRLANRVIWVLTTGKSDSADALYDTALGVDWQQHIDPSQTFSVQFHGTNRAITNTQFGAVKIKDAIVDQFNEELGRRPSVERQRPDVPLYARCHRDQLTLGIDLSGSSLHQRAYRQQAGEAPLKEHIACAMLMRSGWTANKQLPLVDMMCGSGTIAIEAAYIARNIAPGIKREYWGFNRWLGHAPAVWEKLVSQALLNQTEAAGEIIASDHNPQLVAMARKNADHAGVFSNITFLVQDAVTSPPPVKTEGYVVSNPPYGERLNELTDLIPLFAKWGHTLKESWQGWQITLLSSNRDLLRTLKLRANKDYAMNNGKLECRLVNYSMDEANCQQFGAEADNHEFANRIKKNLKRLKGWLKQQDTNCYRIYDADLPDYNVAVDRYDDYLVVQEYAPPKTISEEKARRRLQEVLLHLPAVCEVSAKKVVLKVRSQQKGKSQYERLAQHGKKLTVWENGAKFLVNLTDYLDTGLFLDHRLTRQWVKQHAHDKDVLNLFCYTGSVSVFAAKGGARSVTSVDMSNTYLEWSKENFACNNLQGPYAFVQADCTKWLASHKGKYDLIFIDPPSFSNSKRMDATWDVQRDHLALLTQARKCLREDGTILFSNNRRGFKLNYDELAALGFAITDISAQTIPEDFARHSSIHKCWILQL